MKIKLIAQILLVTVSAPLFGHFFRSERYDLSEFGYNTQTVYLISDFHQSNKKENKNQIKIQQEDLINIAKELDAHVIVEDGMIDNYQELINDSTATIKPKYFTKEQLSLQKMITPLHGLSSACYLQGIDCTNAEYRFTSYRALNVYCKFFENIKKQIRNTYKDGTAFERYYEQRLQFLENSIEKPCKKLFDLFKKSPLTIDELLERNQLPRIAAVDTILDSIMDEKWDLQQMPYTEKIHTILTKYGCVFLDLEILHALALAKNKKNVIICAGDFHIECLKEALQQIGYKASKQYGTYIQYSNDDYIEPDAINIRTAHNILSKPVAHQTGNFVIALLMSSLYIIQLTLSQLILITN